MVLPCNCKHHYQDRIYGTGNRVHNKCEAGYRCTVCLATKKDTVKEAPKEKPVKTSNR